MDERLRGLEREAIECGTGEAGARLLRERMRIGLLDEERVRLAGLCGHPAARLMLGFGDDPLPSKRFDLYKDWLAELEAWAHRLVLLRVGLSTAKRALVRWELQQGWIWRPPRGRKPGRYMSSVPSLTDHRFIQPQHRIRGPREALAGLEAWLDCRCADGSTAGWLACPCEEQREVWAREGHELRTLARVPWMPFAPAGDRVEADAARYTRSWEAGAIAGLAFLGWQHQERIIDANCRDLVRWALG